MEEAQSFYIKLERSVRSELSKRRNIAAKNELGYVMLQGDHRLLIVKSDDGSNNKIPLSVEQFDNFNSRLSDLGLASAPVTFFLGKVSGYNLGDGCIKAHIINQHNESLPKDAKVLNKGILSLVSSIKDASVNNTPLPKPTI